MNKKAVSVMIGYVLLITAALVMGVIVYQWLRTYVPIDAPKCSDEISAFIKKIECDPIEDTLTLTLKNNGKFNLGGYFIHVSTDSDQEIATIDLSADVTVGGIPAGGSVIYSGGSVNPLSPNEELVSVFDLDTYIIRDGPLTQIRLIEIIPSRFQKIRNKMTFVSCGNAKIKENINDASCVFTNVGE